IFIFIFLQVRVCVEHAFAALKGWLQSLRELRLNIHTERELQIAVHWIMCCIILHNMIIRFEAHHRKQNPQFSCSQRWAEREARKFAAQEIEEPDGDEVVGDRLYEGTPGQACLRMMDQLFDSPYSRAEYREG
ncbi:hypothetical protein BDR07DRAFT_1299525, partial [Suillus spraguei]